MGRLWATNWVCQTSFPRCQCAFDRSSKLGGKQTLKSVLNVQVIDAQPSDQLQDRDPLHQQPPE